MRCVTRLAMLLLIVAVANAPAQSQPSGIERAVQEFKIQTKNLGLRADGSRKRKRRRNRAIGSWHGRVFWNFRNDVLDAVPHEVTQTGRDKGILQRNQYGFNVSGPVVIPKLYDGGNATFFSLSYEGMRETIGRSYLRTIPTAPERLGDFSRTVDKSGDPLPLFDPNTTRLNPDFNADLPVATDNLQYLRDPYPGNVIPKEQLDPVAMAALPLYPAANVNIGPFDQNNYSIYSPERNEADGMRGKVDHAFWERQRLSVGFAFSNGFSGPARFFDTPANPGRPNRDFRSRSIRGEHTFTISPTSVNDVRFVAWTSTSENVKEAAEGGAPFPRFRFSPYLSMGRSYPVSRTARTNYEISDNYSMRIGAHSLRMGGQLQRELVNSFWPQYPSGSFNFSDGLTSLPGIVNTGHAFGSFLLGLSSFAEGSVVKNPSYFRIWDAELFVRDEWELTSNLTLSFGLTLNATTPRVEKFDRQSTVDLKAINPANGLPGALVFANRNGEGRAFQKVWMPVEPWFAFSWSPFEGRHTVVRASYRRRVRSPSLYSGQWGTQGFIGTPTYISDNTQLEPAVVLREGLPRPPEDIPNLKPDAANDTIADLVAPSQALPTYDYARLSVERQLPWSFIVRLGANYTRGRNMFADDNGVNPNAIPLDDLAFRDQLNDEEFNRSRRPYPQYQRFDVQRHWPVGRYQRSEGYLQVEKRTSQGLSLRMNYAFSKQMDDYNGDDGLQDYYNRKNEWALNQWSDPQRLSLSYMYELPFGPSKTMLTAADWKRYLVEGWSISGMTTYSSGDPVALRAEFNNTGRVVDALYVDAVPGVEARVANQTPDQWFNAAAFINPPDFAIGNVARTHPFLHNPRRQNHDLSVTKRVALAADRAIEFTGTAFNFLNHADWNKPDADIGTAENPNTNAGKIIGSRGGRVIQLGLRVTF